MSIGISLRSDATVHKTRKKYPSSRSFPCGGSWNPDVLLEKKLAKKTVASRISGLYRLTFLKVFGWSFKKLYFPYDDWLTKNGNLKNGGLANTLISLLRAQSYITAASPAIVEVIPKKNTNKSPFRWWVLFAGWDDGLNWHWISG